ncbi:MAG: glycosyltransferase [Flavobacteriales bacterium]|nr:glycosyltransferase [Flavobacteriales bacterium]
MRIAIVIPCHNVERLLPEALASVAAQQYRDLELVLVDDGSNDGTAAVMEEWARTHAHVKVLRLAHTGAAHARNAGLKACTADWVQFLDADDTLHPDKISGQVALLAAQPHADVVVGDYEQLLPNGRLIPVEALHDQPWMALIKTRMGTTSANLWRRAAVERAGAWDESLESSQDYDLLFRMLKQVAQVCWDRRVTTTVLKRVTGSISRTDEHANWQRYIALRAHMRDHLREAGPREHATEIAVLDQYLFMAIREVGRHDAGEAALLYERLMPRGFQPEESRAITRRYLHLFNLLGFAGAEHMLHLLKRPNA